MAEEFRPRLGRGLAALMGEAGDDVATHERARGQRRIPIEFVRPNPNNPRRQFDDASLEELAGSIREKGIIQPILVRAIAHVADAFEIVAGERRWRAAQKAGLRDVPALVIEASDRDSLELAIIENVQRTDLNAIEEAQGYHQLGEEFKYSQADLAKIIGKSRSYVANSLRLLKLSDATRGMVIEGLLSAGHARALLSVGHPDAVAKRVVAEGLTVRDVERIAQDEATAPSRREGAKAKGRTEKDADTRSLERALSDTLGMIVSLTHRGEAGEMTIRYRNLEQLDSLCHKLKMN